MDIATIIGVILGLSCTIISILIDGKLGSFWSIPSVFVVLGGGIASTLISYRIGEVLKIFKVVGHAFKNSKSTNIDTIALMVKLSEKTRREGLLAIESELEQIEDPYIRRSLQLVVDGVESETIKDYMNMEIENMQARHGRGQALFKTLGALFPAWGMIGTLIGLINLLESLDDPSKIGPAMAIALITTFYGSVLANFICIPIANKLKLKSDEEIHMKEMIAEAVISIQAGENPKMMEHKLRVFLKPDEREVELKKDTDGTLKSGIGSDVSE